MARKAKLIVDKDFRIGEVSERSTRGSMAHLSSILEGRFIPGFISRIIRRRMRWGSGKMSSGW